MKRSMILAVLCATALVAAGCGGDDDNQALSYDDTGTEISEVCNSLDDLGTDLNGEPANDAPILAEDAPRFEDAINEVRELDVHEDLEDARDAFVANGEEQLAIINEAQQIAESGDKKAYREKLEEGQSLDAESNEFASDLGATDCID